MNINCNEHEQNKIEADYRFDTDVSDGDDEDDVIDSFIIYIFKFCHLIFLLNLNKINLLFIQSQFLKILIFLMVLIIIEGIRGVE